MTKNSIEYLLWDWNGTLLNDVWLCVEVMNGILEKYNKEQITAEKYKSVFDFPVKDYYQRLGFDFSKTPFEKVGTDFIVDYDKRTKECNLHTGSHEILNEILQLGIRQSILSAREQKVLSKEVEYFGINGQIEHIIGLNDHYGGRKVDNAKAFLKSRQLNPAKVLMVGDTVHDFEVANQTGMQCVLVASGHHTKEKLQTTGALIVENISDVVGFVKEKL